MKIAALQMISGPDVAPNLAAAGRLIAGAAMAGAQLVALPEYFPLIGATDFRTSPECGLFWQRPARVSATGEPPGITARPCSMRLHGSPC